MSKNHLQKQFPIVLNKINKEYLNNIPKDTRTQKYIQTRKQKRNQNQKRNQKQLSIRSMSTYPFSNKLINTDEKMSNNVFSRLLYIYWSSLQNTDMQNIGRNWSKHHCSFVGYDGMNSIYTNNPYRNIVGGKLVGNTIHAEANAVDNILRNLGIGLRLPHLYKSFTSNEQSCFLRELHQKGKG